MNSEFWTTLLNSPVMAAIVEAALVCFCILRLQSKKNKELEEEKALIQHDCDIRLERYRLEFNQLLSEHQTRFKYWHDEKAKAIKGLYFTIQELFCSLTEFLFTFNEFKKHGLDQKREAILEEKYSLFDSAHDNAYIEWLKNKLFLDEKEDAVIECFFKECSQFVQNYINYRKNHKADAFVEKGFNVLEKTKTVLPGLRKAFREALNAPTIEKQNGVQTESKKQNEAKS